MNEVIYERQREITCLLDVDTAPRAGLADRADLEVCVQRPRLVDVRLDLPELEQPSPPGAISPPFLSRSGTLTPDGW